MSRAAETLRAAACDLPLHTVFDDAGHFPLVWRDNMIETQQPVANVVLDHSETAKVFQKYQVDFCCHGEHSIEVAAKERGIDVDELLEALNNATNERGAQSQGDPRELSTERLIAHIISTHHEYLRSALPFICELAAKVGQVQGDKNAKLRDLDAVISELADGIGPHLETEEETLFPALMAGDADSPVVSKELDAMVEDHYVVKGLLQRIRAASDEFTLPDWACNTYSTLFRELEHLEGDIFSHVHLENHVLKPRFIAA